MRKFLSIFLFGLVVSPAAAKPPECTSMCHLFEAYALARVCPNFTLTKGWDRDYQALFGGERAAPQFKATAMDGVLYRISQAKDVCHGCDKVADDQKEGTACQYLQARAVTPDK
jgi:hypothetical protein